MATPISEIKFGKAARVKKESNLEFFICYIWLTGICHEAWNYKFGPTKIFRQV